MMQSKDRGLGVLACPLILLVLLLMAGLAPVVQAQSADPLALELADKCVEAEENDFLARSGQITASVRFRVTTTAGALIEARLEQLAYNRTESGQGGLTTQIVPAAPIGTRGKLTVRDPATGETVEQPWTWINLGGGWSLWGFIKRLIWPGK